MARFELRGDKSDRNLPPAKKPTQSTMKKYYDIVRVVATARTPGGAENFFAAGTSPWGAETAH